MIDHTALHQEYMVAGLIVTGTNGDGSPNFRFNHPDEVNHPSAAAEIAGIQIEERRFGESDQAHQARILEALGDLEKSKDEKTAAQRKRLVEFRKKIPEIAIAVAHQRKTAEDVLTAHLNARKEQ